MAVNEMRRVAATRFFAAAIIAGACGSCASRPPAAPPAVRPLRFAIPLPPEHHFSGVGRQLLTLSSDGRRLVYPANNRLYLRQLDELTATPIPGTEGSETRSGRSPFFSPDGQWIGFWIDGQLRKVPVDGGPAVQLCGAQNPFGVSWGGDGTIVLGQGPQGISRVSSDGGEAELIATVEDGHNAHGPQILPGGRQLLFTIDTSHDWSDAQIVVQSLDTGERTVVIEGGTDARYLATGHLVYARHGVLFAVPFDAESLQTTGPATPLVHDVAQAPSVFTGAAHFAISNEGTLAYIPGDFEGDARALVWVDRDGREDMLRAPPRAYRHPRLSPDGRRLVVESRDESNDLWLVGLQDGSMARLTSDPASEQYPVWLPHGREIIASLVRRDLLNLFRIPTNPASSVERLREGAWPQYVDAASPDGRTLIVREERPGQSDLLLLELDGERNARALLQTRFDERNADIAPDGRRFAYQSNATGTDEIYVAAYPDSALAGTRVSIAGGSHPVWADNAGELYYRSPLGEMMRVAIDPATGVVLAPPAVLFSGPYYAGTRRTGRQFDVAPDGQRFLMIKRTGDRANLRQPTTIVVVRSWSDQLQ